MVDTPLYKFLMNNFKNSDSSNQSPEFLSIEDIKEGQAIQDHWEITEDLLNKFIALTQDTAPAHTDQVHAKKMGYKSSLVHGMLVASGYSKLLGMFLPGANTVIQKTQFEMIAPVYLNDVLTYQINVNRVIPSVNAVSLNLSAINQDGELVNRGKATCVFRL